MNKVDPDRGLAYGMNQQDFDRIRVLGPRTFEEAEAAQQAFCTAVHGLLTETTPAEVAFYQERVVAWLRWMPLVRMHFGAEIERRSREATLVHLPATFDIAEGGGE